MVHICSDSIRFHNVYTEGFHVCLPICGLAAVEAAVLDLRLTDIEMGDHVAVHRHILPDHESFVKKRVLM